MANIVTSPPAFYSNGNSGASAIVGYEGGRTRVVRYSFTIPAEGATQIGFWSNGITRGDSDCRATSLSAKITLDANNTPPVGDSAHGTLNYSGGIVSGYIYYTFKPATTYYLWIYPSSKTYGYWSWPNLAQTVTSGGSTAATVPSISPSSATIGISGFSINAQPPIEGYVCKLAYKVNDINVPDAEDTTGYYSPNVTLSADSDGFVKTFRSATSGNSAILTVTCHTYSNLGELVGTKEQAATVFAPNSGNYYEMYFKPNVSLEVESITENTVVRSWETNGIYVSGYSKLKLLPTYSPHLGDSLASLSYYQLSCGEDSWDGNTLATEYICDLTAGTITPEITARDSRGSEVNMRAQTCRVFDYNPPAFRISDKGRCHSDSSGIVEGGKTYTPAANGTKAYIKLSSVTFSGVDNNNRCVANVFCNGISIGSFQISNSVNTYEYIVSLDEGLNLNEKYQITITLTDSLSSVHVNTEIQKRSVGLHLKKGGLGVAVGKPAEEDGLFDIGFKARFCEGVQPAKLSQVSAIDSCVYPNLYLGSSSSFGGNFALEVLPLPNSGSEARAFQRISYYSNGTLTSAERFQVLDGTWSEWERPDSIIEQGTTGKWSWRKWHSGIAECWGVFSVESLSISQAWGALFWGTWMSTDVNKNGRKYPFEFIENPIVIVSAIGGTKDFFLVTDSGNNTGTATTHAPAYALASPVASTVTAPKISYYVRGRLERNANPFAKLGGLGDYDSYSLRSLDSYRLFEQTP